jgi:hypothetical protein
MSEPRRRTPARRSRRRRPAPAREFWGSPDFGDDVIDVITPANDPTTMLRSLGPAPFPGGDTVAEHYFAAVYLKASAMAIALAAASDLLPVDDPDAYEVDSVS